MAIIEVIKHTGNLIHDLALLILAATPSIAMGYIAYWLYKELKKRSK